MYLLTFVILVIGLIGIYAQVLTLQAGRIAAQQTGLATTMMTWHSAAVSMGASIVSSGAALPAPTTACSLTIVSPNAAAVPFCATPIGSPSANGTVTADAASGYALNQLANGQKVHLPASYQTAAYQFYSILYQDTTSPNNQPYVLTFVQPPTISATNPAPGFINLAVTGNLLSVTMVDLVHQLQTAGVPAYAYGTVVNNGTTSTLFTGSLTDTNGGASSFQYKLPGVFVGNGALAVISPASGN